MQADRSDPPSVADRINVLHPNILRGQSRWRRRACNAADRMVTGTPPDSTHRLRETSMLKRSTSVRSALSFACTLLGVAPAAAARKLVARTGDPIRYRIGLPEEAEIEERPGLLAAQTGNLSVIVVATDMLEGEQNPLPLPEAESRRILTSIIMGSDALLFALLDEEFRRRKLELGNVVRGIGTLGGQRSACVRGRFEERGVEGWLDMHATVKGGIMYMLAFTVLSDDLAPHEALLARIHDSFALPR
jgi:hypothetical protein